MFEKYRKQRGYTQEELAEMVEISWRQMQRIERGKCTPTIETLAKLVKALKINEKDLMEYLNIYTKRKDEEKE